MILDEVKVMDMSFDVRKVFQERLASSMGLVLTVPIGVGMENSVIFIPDNGYSALQE